MLVKVKTTLKEQLFQLEQKALELTHNDPSYVASLEQIVNQIDTNERGVSSARYTDRDIFLATTLEQFWQCVTNYYDSQKAKIFSEHFFVILSLQELDLNLEVKGKKTVKARLLNLFNITPRSAVLKVIDAVKTHFRGNTEEILQEGFRSFLQRYHPYQISKVIRDVGSKVLLDSVLLQATVQRCHARSICELYLELPTTLKGDAKVIQLLCQFASTEDLPTLLGLAISNISPDDEEAEAILIKSIEKISSYKDYEVFLPLLNKPPRAAVIDALLSSCQVDCLCDLVQTIRDKYPGFLEGHPEFALSIFLNYRNYIEVSPQTRKDYLEEILQTIPQAWRKDKAAIEDARAILADDSGKLEFLEKWIIEDKALP